MINWKLAYYQPDNRRQSDLCGTYQLRNTSGIREGSQPLAAVPKQHVPILGRPPGYTAQCKAQEAAQIIQVCWPVQRGFDGISIGRPRAPSITAVGSTAKAAYAHVGLHSDCKTWYTHNGLGAGASMHAVGQDHAFVRFCTTDSCAPQTNLG